MFVSPPVAAIDAPEPVALLVIVISLTAEAVLSKIAISLSEESSTFTLPSAPPPVPPLINTSPDARVPVPLPPLITASPASAPEVAAPPETVKSSVSSAITSELPPEDSLITTAPLP